MSAVLAVIAVVSGLLVLLLAVPVGVAFRFQGIEAFKGQITIRWLFGLVRFCIDVPDFTEAQPPRPGTGMEAAKLRVKRKKRGRATNVLAVLQKAAFRRQLYRLVTDLVHAAHLHELSIRVRLGLGDPADTGCLWALVGPLNALAQSLRNTEVRVEPEFMDTVFEFEAHGRLLLVPLQLLASAIAFALSLPSIHAWRTLRGRHA
ncbi:MAG: DUF2953 domain-containing protein [Burkholderiaceae bacterium]|nr:DUF2953 domain-containing protein [Burkholderiaceae bacterium]